MYVPILGHPVDIKLSIVNCSTSRYQAIVYRKGLIAPINKIAFAGVERSQTLFYFVQSQEYRSQAGSTSRRNNLRVVGKE